MNRPVSSVECAVPLSVRLPPTRISATPIGMSIQSTCIESPERVVLIKRRRTVLTERCC